MVRISACWRLIRSLPGVPGPEDLELIGRYTRRPLGAEEVYVFPVVLCDNEVDRAVDLPDQLAGGLPPEHIGVGPEGVVGLPGGGETAVVPLHPAAVKRLTNAQAALIEQQLTERRE